MVISYSPVRNTRTLSPDIILCHMSSNLTGKCLFLYFLNDILRLIGYLMPKIMLWKNKGKDSWGMNIILTGKKNRLLQRLNLLFCIFKSPNNSWTKITELYRLITRNRTFSRIPNSVWWPQVMCRLHTSHWKHSGHLNKQMRWLYPKRLDYFQCL